MLRFHTARRQATSVLVATLLFSGCSQPHAPRPPGAIAITGTVQVAELSAFGFGVSIDSATPIAMTSSGPMSHLAAGLTPGRHSVALKQLPSNCTSGADSRVVDLRGGDTVGVRFDVVCVRTTGDVMVKVITTGLELDPDGYRLLLDNVDRGAVAVNTQQMLDRVQPGTRTIALTGLAPNCTAQGSISRAIGVTAGATLNVEFAVLCRATTGTVILRTTRTGSDIDPDGVTFSIGGVRFATLGAPQIIVPRLAVGRYNVTISDVEPNCTLAGSATSSITVAGADTVIVTATEVCAAIGAGVEGFVIDEPVNDTLPRTSTGTPGALDVRRISGRYAAGFVMLTVRFGGPIASAARNAANSLYGWLDLDVDESTTTGAVAAVNSFGGSAQQGVDYRVYFLSVSDNLTYVAAANGTPGYVATRFDGDSVTISIPLTKLGGDDGNMTITGVVGTKDRPTDIVPNTGQLLARRPAVAAALRSAEPSSRETAHGAGLVPAADAKLPALKVGSWPN